MAKPLTDVQREALRAVDGGLVTVKEHYFAITTVRQDVYGRLEERGLVAVDWDAPVDPTRPPKFQWYPVRITDAGRAALRDGDDG